jgi:hypothetical protein
MTGTGRKYSPCARQGIAAGRAVDDELYAAAAAEPEPALATAIEETHA